VPHVATGSSPAPERARGGTQSCSAGSKLQDVPSDVNRLQGVGERAGLPLKCAEVQYVHAGTAVCMSVFQ
jgi:hypothetical protein